MTEGSPFGLAAQVGQRLLLPDKLRVPHARSDAVARGRLIRLLNDALDRPLTVICAPAGYGKTTLLADWVKQSDLSVAWVSLDEDDDQPARFWAYVLAALQPVSAELADTWLTLLPPGDDVPDGFLVALLNELRAVDGDFVLILDDYHTIKSEVIHGGLARLIEHAPPQLHVVLATRATPFLPIARLAARDQLTELGGGDLSFTSDETEAFFRQVGLSALSGTDVSLLWSKTEGWAAGLRLAALSMLNRNDSSAFAAKLSGSNRRIADYLVDEVLVRQPPRVRDFMLKTAMLGRLCGPLCNAVLGRTLGYSQSILEHLERTNAFIISLDDERCWYRYHHLFGGLLRTRLHQAHPDLVAVLAHRASVWHEQNGSYDEAIKMALAGNDVERVAELIQANRSTMLEQGDHASLLGWLGELPPKLVRSRPSLSLAKAWALVPSRRLAEAEDCLADVEAAIAPARGKDDNSARVRVMRGEIPAVRAMMAMAEYDAPRLITACEQALETLPDNRESLRVFISLHLGVAHKLTGDFDAARQELVKVTRHRSSSTMLRYLGHYYLACIPQRQGHIREAEAILKSALEQVRSDTGGELPIAGLAHVALASLAYERNHLDAAERHLETALPLIERFWIEGPAREAYITLGRIELARGQRDKAMAHFMKSSEALRVYVPDPFMTQPPTPTLRLWIEMGYIENAMQIIEAVGRSQVADGLLGHQLAEKAHASAHLLIAHGRYDEALHLLEPVLAAFEQRGVGRQVIEVLVLRSIAMASLGDDADALMPLVRALLLARREGFIRTFVDEGPPMLRLLEMARVRRVCPEYVDQLIAAFPESDSALTPQDRSSLGPLTAREIEILRFAAGGLSAQKTAEKLVISIHTVREHQKHIYGKLDVHTRLQAVQRGIELNLL